MTAKISTQFASKFYFRGLDVLDRVSPEDASSGISASKVNLEFADGAGGLWQAGFGYIQALESQLPNDAARGQGPNLVDASGKSDRRLSNYENYRMRSRERYSEMDFNLGYSRTIVGGLSGSLGVGYYHFGDEGWWGADSTTELTFGLNYATKWASLATSYTYDLDAFDGGFLEFGVTGRAIPLWQKKDSIASISVIPKIRTAYDFDYNGDNNGWNNVQFGLDFPLRLTRNLGLTLGVNYSKDLGDSNNDGSRRTDDGFWFTATLGAGDRIWPRTAAAAAAGVVDSKNPIPGLVTEKSELNGWRFSGGISQRTIHANLNSHVKPLIRATELFDHKQDKGSERLANGDETIHYIEGSVSNDIGGGVGIVQGVKEDENSEQDALDRNEQILFTSRLYEYPNDWTRYNLQDNDKDSAISPYVRLDREIWRQGRFSITTGLSYSFTSAEMDSGTGLAILDHGYERILDRYFLYNVDYQTGSSDRTRVIVNGLDYSKNPVVQVDANLNYGGVAPDRGPQMALLGTQTEKAKVATFVRSGLDVDMHSMSLPFAMTLDLGERLHISFEAGPTLNLFNYDLRTEAWAQRLSNTGDPSVFGRTPNFRENQGVFSSEDFIEGDTSDDPPATLPSRGGSIGAQRGKSETVITRVNPDAPQKPAKPGKGAPPSGKGGNYKNPELPGSNVAHDSWREDGVRARFGAFAQLGVQYDLNDADTWFVDVWGRYDYVRSFTISNGTTSAEIDPSAWTVGAGIGYRF